MITVSSVETAPVFELLLVFDGGERRRFDMRPYLLYPAFRRLENPGFFSLAHVVRAQETWSVPRFPLFPPSRAHAGGPRWGVPRSPVAGACPEEPREAPDFLPLLQGEGRGEDGVGGRVRVRPPGMAPSPPSLPLQGGGAGCAGLFPPLVRGEGWVFRGISFALASRPRKAGSQLAKTACASICRCLAFGARSFPIDHSSSALTARSPYT